MAKPSALTVMKIGGSVLAGDGAYHQAAEWLAARLDASQHAPIVVVVSAEYGHTDRLLSEARAAAADRRPDQDALDLLWSTGEVRSVALLTLALRAVGVKATGLGLGETGLTGAKSHIGQDSLHCNPLLILAALSTASVVVVPGFVATEAGRVITLGRGGSDWSAVRLAVGLGARHCELIKDVDGYFTADPRTDPCGQLLPTLSYERALEMAAEGCPLVQEQALRAGQGAGLELVVRGMNSPGTRVGAKGVRGTKVPRSN
jgi:aspartate kinase